ncbi:MAG TPA: archease, partial [Thermodesulfovibrionales bacterium]|nr:archease [Thermodesulfovibrionales bacterium]
MKTFDVIDISGDAGIRAYGGTIEELFVNAATGLYSLITDSEGIREKKELPVEVESHALESLLVSWLNELIFHFDT